MDNTILYGTSYEPGFEGKVIAGTAITKYRGETFLLLDWGRDEWDDIASLYNLPHDAGKLPSFEMTGVTFVRVFAESVFELKTRDGSTWIAKIEPGEIPNEEWLDDGIDSHIKVLGIDVR
jgi:hypothetical protein